MQEEKVDIRLLTPADWAAGQRQRELIFRFNQTLPGSEENTPFCRSSWPAGWATAA